MEQKKQNSRRKAVKGVIAAAAAGLVVSQVNAAENKAKSSKKVVTSVTKSNDVPLFSGGVAYGNLLFIAGKGAHFEGDITSHTDHVLKELEKEKRNHLTVLQLLNFVLSLVLVDHYQLNCFLLTQRQ